MTLGGPKRFLLKNREKNFHISGVAEQLENVSDVGLEQNLWQFLWSDLLMPLEWSACGQGRIPSPPHMHLLPEMVEGGKIGHSCGIPLLTPG